METKDKKLQDIEKAFSLIETTDFQQYVNILKGQTLESLEYWFQDRITVLPDIKQISVVKDKRLADNERLFEAGKNKPDRKLWFQSKLYSIAKRILSNVESLERIREGRLPFLNMSLVGHLWADSETLIKHRDKLLNWNNESSTQPEGLQCIDNIKTEDLKFIFSKLKGMLHKSVIESDFVNAFQAGALPIGWKRINWTGSKKMLSTLVWKLTGEKPRPIEINRIFIVKPAFDSRDCVTAIQIENRHHHLDIKRLFPDPE